jgi:TRAP-type C4-dicarboxylate transport system permease large subunit
MDVILDVAFPGLILTWILMLFYWIYLERLESKVLKDKGYEAWVKISDRHEPQMVAMLLIFNLLAVVVVCIYGPN